VRPVYIIAILALLQLTSPDGATLWISPDDIGPFRSGKGAGHACEKGTILYGGAEQTFCVKETPEEINKKIDEHGKKEDE
jgi:hypothetical protein